MARRSQAEILRDAAKIFLRNQNIERTRSQTRKMEHYRKTIGPHVRKAAEQRRLRNVRQRISQFELERVTVEAEYSYSQSPNACEAEHVIWNLIRRHIGSHIRIVAIRPDTFDRTVHPDVEVGLDYGVIADVNYNISTISMARDNFKFTWWYDWIFGPSPYETLLQAGDILKVFQVSEVLPSRDTSADLKYQYFRRGEVHCVFHPIKKHFENLIEEYYQDKIDTLSSQLDSLKKQKNRKKEISALRKQIRNTKSNSHRIEKNVEYCKNMEIKCNEGISVEQMQEVCDELKLHIDVALPFTDDKPYLSIFAQRPDYTFRFLNSDWNHVENFPAKIEGNKASLSFKQMVYLNTQSAITLSQEDMQQKMKELIKANTFFWYNSFKSRDVIGLSMNVPSVLYTTDAVYKIESDYKQCVIAFENEFPQLKEVGFDSIQHPLQYDFIRSGIHWNSHVTNINKEYRKWDSVYPLEKSNIKECYKNEELVSRLFCIDLTRSYANFSKCIFYEGFPYKLISGKCDKIQGLGLYLIDNISYANCSDTDYDILRILGFPFQNKNHYTSVELKYLDKFNIKYDVKCGVWSTSSFHFEFPEYMQKEENGCKHYAKWVGQLDIADCEDQKIRVYGSSEQLMSHISSHKWINNQRGNTHVYSIDKEHGAFELVMKKKSTSYRGILAAFINSYEFGNIVDQLVHMDLSKVVQIQKDAIIYEQHEFSKNSTFKYVHEKEGGGFVLLDENRSMFEPRPSFDCYFSRIHKTFESMHCEEGMIDIQEFDCTPFSCNVKPSNSYESSIRFLRAYMKGELKVYEYVVCIKTLLKIEEEQGLKTERLEQVIESIVNTGHLYNEKIHEDDFAFFRSLYVTSNLIRKYDEDLKVLVDESYTHHNELINKFMQLPLYAGNGSIEVHKGPGGKGKTHNLATDPSLLNVLYVAPCWRLCSDKNADYHLKTTVLHRLVDPQHSIKIKKKYHTIIIDECSMIWQHQAEQIINMYTGCTLYFVGDPGYQLPPYKEKRLMQSFVPFSVQAMVAKYGAKVVDYEDAKEQRVKCEKHSQLLKTIRKAMKEVMDDPCNWKGGCRENGITPEATSYFAKECKKFVLENFKSISQEELKSKYELHDMVLTSCVSEPSPYVKEYNELLQDKHMPLQKYRIMTNTHQSCNGDVVIACANDLKDKTNSIICDEEEMDDDFLVLLKAAPPPPTGKTEIRHADTIHSIQGQTAFHNLYIDPRNMFSFEHWYTALSRAQYWENVYIVNVKEKDEKNNYKWTKIYKISSPQTEFVYIGYTIQTLNSRFCQHKEDQKCFSREILYFDDAKMELVENYPCNTKEEAESREKWWMLQYPNCVNKV